MKATAIDPALYENISIGQPMTVGLYRAFKNITEQERLNKLNDKTLGKEYFKKIENIDDISKIKVQNSAQNVKTTGINPALYENISIGQPMTVGLFRAFKNSFLEQEKPKLDAYKTLEKYTFKNSEKSMKTTTIDPALYENIMIGQPMTVALYRAFRNV